MKQIILFFILFLICSCSTSTKKSKDILIPEVTVISPEEVPFDELEPVENKESLKEVDENWNYPGKFLPQPGDTVSSFTLSGKVLSKCQSGKISVALINKINRLMTNKEFVVEEYKHFLQLKINGSDYFFIKYLNTNLANRECESLKSYLIKTFNFSGE